MEIIQTLDGWQDWMINWVHYDSLDKFYYVYEPDNDLLCKTPSPALAIESFKHSLYGREDHA